MCLQGAHALVVSLRCYIVTLMTAFQRCIVSVLGRSEAVPLVETDEAAQVMDCGSQSARHLV